MKGFGLAPDSFKTAIDRYGLWPLTVWQFNMQDYFTQKLKDLVGDGAEKREGSETQGYRKMTRDSARKGCFHPQKSLLGKTFYRISESIFNPAIAINILKLFAPKKGTVYDPFAGGGTRAILTCKFGLKYIGVEIRKEEAQAVRDRAFNNGIKDGLTIIVGNSCRIPEIKSGTADLLMTCPPYWNLEKYNGGEGDLSMAKTYDDFLIGIEQVVRESQRILKPGSLSCWVVGLHRDKDGILIPINHDISAIHRNMGFRMKEEVILHITGQGLERRVCNFERGNRFLVRNHEYLLIFVR